MTHITLHKFMKHIEPIKQLLMQYGFSLKLFKQNVLERDVKALNVLARDTLGNRTLSDLLHHTRLLKESLVDILNCPVSVYLENDPELSPQEAEFFASSRDAFELSLGDTDVHQLLTEKLERFYGKDWMFDKLPKRPSFLCSAIFAPAPVQKPLASKLISEAKQGNVVELEELLKRAFESNTNVDVTDERGETALSAAILHNQLKAVDLLLKYGSDPYSASSSSGERILTLLEQRDVGSDLRELVNRYLDDKASTYCC